MAPDDSAISAEHYDIVSSLGGVSKQPRPICMFCASDGPMTREHIFRSSWKRKIDTNEHLANLPFFDRKFTRYGIDNSERQTKSEDLFSTSVKRVCAPCNNNWMNDLDSVVEPWVFDPSNDDRRCDPKEFRRWATKIALLRSYYENPRIIQPGDPAKIYAGEDIPDWHVFIGRTQRPEHRHSFCGVGPIRPDGGRLYGVTQVSWTLGHSLVTALRVVTGGDELSQLLNESSHGCLKNFKQYNRWRGIEVLEVLPAAQRMPSVRPLPALPIPEVQRLVWLFTTNPISPIAKEVREAHDGMKGYWKRLASNGLRPEAVQAISAVQGLGFPPFSRGFFYLGLAPSGWRVAGTCRSTRSS